MSPIINGLITVIISVAVMASYNYFTANNTPPPVAVMPTDVPIGTMLPYAGNKIPAGWLACDNAAYPTTTYPLLYAAIGYTYGMDGSNYRVPDTRGVFMRGMDATATRDANRPAGSIQLSGTVPDTNSVFTGASASATGGVGYVPAPLAGQQNYALTGNGKWSPVINSYTRVAAAGKQNILFASIPAYVNRITIMLTNVAINSGAVPVAQLGAGSIQASGYYSISSYIGPTAGNGGFVDGWYVSPASRGGDVRHGNYYITHSGGNLWTCTGSFVANDNYISFCGGSVQLSGVLDQVRLATNDGKSIFTNGTVNILYE